jgi:uncharacterized protein
MRRILAALATLPLLAGASACAQDLPPRPDGPVADLANILPEQQEAYLDKKLRAFFDGNCIAIIVASVDSLKDQPIETFANRLAKGWEIGNFHAHQGMLVLVAPQERKVRIEISNSVNRVITDKMAKAIIDQTMVPAYRTGDLATGTLSGVDAIIARLDAGRGSDGLDRESCRAAEVSS